MRVDPRCAAAQEAVRAYRAALCCHWEGGLLGDPWAAWRRMVSPPRRACPDGSALALLPQPTDDPPVVPPRGGPRPPPFSTLEIRAALRSCRPSGASDPDGIPPAALAILPSVRLRHPPPRELRTERTSPSPLVGLCHSARAQERGSVAPCRPYLPSLPCLGRGPPSPTPLHPPPASTWFLPRKGHRLCHGHPGCDPGGRPPVYGEGVGGLLQDHAPHLGPCPRLE